jgi:hypothetical protein
MTLRIKASFISSWPTIAENGYGPEREDRLVTPFKALGCLFLAEIRLGMCDQSFS